jgi:hypothetical protein
MAPSTKPFRLAALVWPITSRQWQALSDMIEDIYRRLKEGVEDTAGLVFTVLGTGLGFTVAGGDATLTVPSDATISGTSSGTNTGDQTITLTGDITGSGTGSFVTDIAPGVIVNADVNAAAAIVDTKLDTIATALKVSNSATTATALNTASAIVARDASGDFVARTPTLTSAIVPLVIGGTAVGSTLTLKPTTGVGTAGAASVFVNVGNNGATEAIRVLNDGKVGIRSAGNPANDFVVGGQGGSNAGCEFAISSDVTFQAYNRNSSAYATFNIDGAVIKIRAASSVIGWQVGAAGHFTALADNTHDIGASGATRPRSIFVGTNVTAGGTVAATTLTGAGSGITALNATNLGSGTVPDARFPATLPAASGVNLTALNATNIASGTLADARLSSLVPIIAGTAPANDQVAVWTAANGIEGNSTLTWSGSNLNITRYASDPSVNMRRANGAEGAETGVLSGEQIGGFQGRGWTSAGAFSGTAGIYAFFAEENFSGTVQGTRCEIYTITVGATTLTKRMTIGHNTLLGAAAKPTAGNDALIFPDSTAPSGLASNTAGIFADDLSGTTVMRGIHEDGTVGTLGLIVTKGTTGEPTPHEGLMVINTFDNTFKVYADGGWRTLASGW